MFDEYDKNWIKEGSSVAHYENQNQKMFVEKFVSRGMPGGMKLLLGVKCYWYEEYTYQGQDKKRYKAGTFHSRHLVPWDVALGGKQNVNMFRKDVLGLD